MTPTRLPYRSHCKVVRSMCVDQPYLSRTKVFSIMDSYNDLDAMAQLSEPARGTPFLTYSEINQIFEYVINSANAHLPGLNACLITAKMPSSTPFTERLLAQDVFMCTDIAQESALLAAQGQNFLALDNRLVRYSLEPGDNSLRFEWHGAAGQQAVFDRFIAQLAEYGIEAVER